VTTSSIGPGTVLGGRYQLQELLSDHEGARFWRATDTVLVRNVAVHAVPTADARAEELLEGARRSATVTEPHLLRVLDCDIEDGIAWVVNEWGAGISLDLMLQRGPLPPSRAAWLVHEVAASIAEAHDRGIAHGCLNPEAVLVTEAGAVKLIGFVVASVLEGPPRNDQGYGDLDPREADVINLAGLLYAALTGRWPGVAPSAVPAAPREGGQPLRPRRVRAGVPRTLDAICTRVLLREGSQHQLPVETAHEVAAALSDYVGDAGMAAPLDLQAMHTEPLPPVVAPTISLHRPATDEPTRQSPAVEDDDPARTALHDALAPDERQPAPPPPPLEEPPERPLFATTERRRNLPPGWPPAADRSDGVAARPVTSTGSGSLPAYWPFAEQRDPVDAPPVGSGGKEGRNWLRLAAVVGICAALLVAMTFAFRLGRDNGHGSSHSAGAGSPSPSATSARLPVVSAAAFDPEGDGMENDAEAPNAIDGRPGTSWQTSTYYGNPRLGGLKSGVGLLLDLGADRTVGSLRVDFVGGPTAVTVYAASPGVHDPPATLTGLHKVSGNRSADGQTVLRLSGGTRTRYLVVWLTRLPPVSGGYRGAISDITVWS
jgi:hypothetical protein